MAKIPCEIIRDLLPLYQDDICSEKSRNAIEEHIKECESCRTYLKKMEGEIPIETDKIEGTERGVEKDSGSFLKKYQEN